MKPSFKQWNAMILSLSVFIALQTEASAQWLQTNGPYGGYIPTIASDGSNIFAGTLGGRVWVRLLSEMVGINEASPENFNFSISPNPTSGQMQVGSMQWAAGSEYKIEIYNVYGKKTD